MDAWQTYTYEFAGGLISNLSPLQHGAKAPGSARTLKNFEPSVEGGYRRIEGYDKFDSSPVPLNGGAAVQGSGQSGSSLNIADIYTAPVAGDSFTISGVTGTYTIAVEGVVFNEINKTATLTLTTALTSSPADKASISFTNRNSLIRGVAYWDTDAYALRDFMLYRSGSGAGWEKMNVPSYGTVLVNGAGQTGTSLSIDGLSQTPNVGDTFSVAGIEYVYTVIAPPTVTAGATTLTITPALAASPADNAAVTWRTCDISDGVKLRVEKYRIGVLDYMVGVDGYNYPFKIEGNTFTQIKGTTDIFGATFAVFFKNQMFFAKDNNLIFTAPYSDSDFSAANGAGVISLSDNITGLVMFRESLIIFTEKSISQIVGNTSADFTLQPVTRNVGCVATDTIQEVGGDIIFLGPEGLRMLSATDRIGDFNLGVVSKAIQLETTQLIESSSSFASVVIKEKSQYRLFGYRSNVTANNAKGVLGTQKDISDSSAIEWAELIGFKCFVADSDYFNQTEVIIFANESGYVYQMESGNSFDGDNIVATFSTPYVYINDPKIRKTFYKLSLYTDPQGSVTTLLNLKFDFDTSGSVQPSTIGFTNTTGSVGFYGNSTATYGTTVFGSKLKKIFSTQVIGSGFFVSLQFSSDSVDPPFSLDAATLEFSTHDRR